LSTNLAQLVKQQQEHSAQANTHPNKQKDSGQGQLFIFGPKPEQIL